VGWVVRKEYEAVWIGYFILRHCDICGSSAPSVFVSFCQRVRVRERLDRFCERYGLTPLFGFWFIDCPSRIMAAMVPWNEQ
jgi:hypothetical protein